MSQIVSRILRLGLVIISGIVLTGIVPISVAQFRTGDACPSIGFIPACYLVTICYAAIGVAAAMWRKPNDWLFFAGAAPVIGLALAGTTAEIVGLPTCPRSATGWPLCYTSLMVGTGIAVTYMVIRRLELQVA
ncbi:MAG: hypothetical protein ABJN34_03085 [Litoreibacter sp.]|uniref:hypothetical protein n=1 Tax=Litoreibacter sp. TaxID=1969459 RepID=UPI00329767D9